MNFSLGMQGCSEKKPVDLKLSVIKPLGEAWMKSAYEYVKSKPDIICNAKVAVTF